jgi:hypothetical protein
VFLGSAGAAVVPAGPVACGAAPEGIVIADLAGSTAPDVAVACENSHAIQVFIGDGAGGFQSSQLVPTGVQPFKLVVGDLDGNGRFDLISNGLSLDRLIVVLNLAQGSITVTQSMRLTCSRLAFKDRDFGEVGTVSIWRATPAMCRSMEPAV